MSAEDQKAKSFDYTYDPKGDKSEYVEFYIVDKKRVLHGIRLRIENVQNKGPGGVRIIKEEYKDGELISITDRENIDFDDRRKIK
jgi:hypothetical protein